MKIQKLTINKYGPIRLAKDIELGEGLNIIIGRNGSGKTTLLDLLSIWSGSENIKPELINKDFYKKELKEGDLPEAVVHSLTALVQGTSSWVFKATENLLNKGNIKRLVEGENFDGSNKKLLIEYIKSARTVSSTAAERNPYQAAREMQVQTGAGVDITASIVKEINDSIWKIIFESEEQTKRNIKKYEDELNSNLVDFEKEIRIDFKKPSNFIYCVDVYDNEVKFASLSPGELEYLYLSFKLQSLLNQEADSTIILVDEPELHLHSSQLFKVAEFVDAISKNNQVLVATHSAELIDYFSNKAKFFLLNEGNLSEISSVGERIDAYNALGIRFITNFLTGPFLLVENTPWKQLSGADAPDTVKLVKRVLKKEHRRKIFIAAAGSAPEAKDKTTLVSQIVGDPSGLHKVAILDADKLLLKLLEEEDLNKWEEIARTESTDTIRYFPFFELENVLLQPKLLSEVGIDQDKFWAKIDENREFLQAAFFKTIIRQKLKASLKHCFEKQTVDEQTRELLTYQKDISERIDAIKSEYKNKIVGGGEKEGFFNQIIKLRSWRWTPGKETFSRVVLGLESDFWKKLERKEIGSFFEKEIKSFFERVEDYLLKKEL